MGKSKPKPERAVVSETYADGLNALASSEILLLAADPEGRFEIYRRAGLERLAENAGPMQQVAAARQDYPELATDDYQLYAAYFTKMQPAKDYSAPPPEGVLAALITAREANVFNEIVVLSHPETGEALLLGAVTIPGVSTHFFKIAQWGSQLTTVESLRAKRSARKELKAKGPGLGQRLARSPLGTRQFRLGLLMLGAALGCWALLWLTNWWIFAVVAGAGLSLLNAYVFSKTRYDQPVRYFTSWVMGLTFAGGAVIGIIDAATVGTTDRHKTVSVCGVTHPNKGLLSGDRVDRWKVETSGGQFRLEPGVYAGAYYSTNDKLEVAAQKLNGQLVRITYHQFPGNPAYATGAEVIRATTCG